MQALSTNQPRFGGCRRSMRACALLPAVFGAWLLCFVGFAPAQDGVDPAGIADPSAASSAARSTPPTAAELDEMMGKLLDPAIDARDKKRLTAVIFYHQDIYREAVIRGEFQADSPRVQGFLEQKSRLQQDVISRMGVKYRSQFGENLMQPIIPFSYNNILSDDDIITGTGEPGRRAERIYNESLSDVMREQIGRPMSPADRRRIDVNGLAWNMTQEAGHRDFFHPEKYINPQSGPANQGKLIEGARAGVVTAYTFDDNGRMIQLSRDQTIQAIGRLDVERQLPIPGLDPDRGSGSTSDFLRMAEEHSIKPIGGRNVTDAEIGQFIRNQKYTERVRDDYLHIFASDQDLVREHRQFLETSTELRNATTARQVAVLLEEAYGIQVMQHGQINYRALTAAMLIHQGRQLNTVLPAMLGEVTRTEAYKIVEWLKTTSPANRNLLRKQMALVYAPLSDAAVAKIASDFDRLSVPEADRNFLKSVVQGDSRQIRRYAEVLAIPPAELASRLQIDGDNIALARHISQSATVRPLNDALAARPGGAAFREFLDTRTARALNLDVMLSPDAKRGPRFMQLTLMSVAATRAYAAAGSREEGLQAMGMAMFEMIPFVASALRFSELEFRESFRELAIDIFPPLGLANIAVVVLGYAAETAKSMFTESLWEQNARAALRHLGDADFEESDIPGYWRLKHRQQFLEYLDEVSPGLRQGFSALASLVEPEIEARMSRHPDVRTNNAAIHTLLWFEDFSVAGVTLRYRQMFDLTQLRARVYESGIPAAGDASPVERVAARILMDNLRIRTEIYYQVLEEFIDRIERLYNEQREGREEEGYGAIVSKAMMALKEIYENAPRKIKDSPWGSVQLDDDYRERLRYLTDYKPSPSDKSDIEIQREMQEILDDFRAFIDSLLLAVDIHQEMRYLDLRAHAYGGRMSLEDTDVLLLGDPFRVGISARVSPERKNLRWVVYYYVHVGPGTHKDLLGQVRLNPRQYDPGNEGRWLIEAPMPETFLNIDADIVETYFDRERRIFRIHPVLAFGDWQSDPLSLVGEHALRNPIDYPHLFSTERMAFIGDSAEIAFFRGTIHAAAPSWVYRDDRPQLHITLRLPDYARERNHAVDIKADALGGDMAAPELLPDRHSPVAVDRFDPPKTSSVSEIRFDDDALDSSIALTIAANLDGIGHSFQPEPRTVIINYAAKDNPSRTTALDDDDAGTITVPGVVGMPRAAAVAAIEAAGLVPAVHSAEAAPSPDQQGLVAAQDPEAEVEISFGSTVRLIVYTAATIEVPGVIGLIGTEAARIIETAGLASAIQQGDAAPDSGQEGLVANQDPAPGSMAAPGSVVQMTVYAPAAIVVPDVIDLPLAQAVAMIEAAELTARPRVGSPASSPDMAGTVERTVPAGGSLLHRGDPVDLDVRIEAIHTVVVPAVIGLLQAEAVSRIQTAQLNATTESAGAAEGPALANRVASQRPTAGMEVAAGQEVQIAIYSELERIEVALPDVIGLPLADAVRRIEAAGLRAIPRTGEEATSDAQLGTVALALPLRDGPLFSGDAVELRVRTERIAGGRLPDVLGMSSSRAFDLISEAGFTPVLVVGEAAPTHSAVDTVARQRPLPGVELALGREVHLSVYGAAEGEPVITAGDSEVEPIWIVARLYLPDQAQDLISGAVTRASEMQGSVENPTEEDIRRFIDDLTAELRALNPDQVVWAPQPQPVVILLQPGAANSFSTADFEPGRRFAVPIALQPEISVADGNHVLLQLVRGAFLMESAAWSHESAGIQGVIEGTDIRPVSEGGRLLEFKEANERVRETIIQQGQTGAFEYGPIELGWSRHSKSEALNLLTELLVVLLDALLSGHLDCFVATAVYGDPDAPQLASLRRFRDRVLAGSESGQALIDLYYRHGPAWAARIGERDRVYVDELRKVLDYFGPIAGAVEPPASLVERGSAMLLWLLDTPRRDRPVTPSIGAGISVEKDIGGAGPPHLLCRVGWFDCDKGTSPDR